MDRLSLKKRKKEEVSERDTWGLSAQNRGVAITLGISVHFVQRVPSSGPSG